MYWVIVYMVYHQNADSYHSHAELPKVVFAEETDAIEYAQQQKGYGYQRDWFVKPVRLYPRQEIS